METNELSGPVRGGAFSVLYGWVYVAFSSVSAFVSYLRGSSFQLEALPAASSDTSGEDLSRGSHLAVRLWFVVAFRPRHQHSI